MSDTMTTLAPHQQRVVAERAELSAKLIALAGFFATGTFQTLDAAERARMFRQIAIMADYVMILDERIAAF